MSSRAFIDIDIGDREPYQRQVEAFQRGNGYYDAVGSQYGLSGPLEGLRPDDLELLGESYSADPAWAAKGEASFVQPTELRAGRLVIELLADACPKTTENFRALCTGERGKGKGSGKPLHYKGCAFHRIVQGFCCQGGDIVRGDGSGGDSIWGGKFNDEKGGLKLKHCARGVVAMANSGKNSNSSQFYVTLGPAPQCDGKHVVFGRVLEGMHVLERIDAEAASADGTPRVDVVIADCGVL